MNHLRDDSSDQCLLTNKRESSGKLEDVLTLLSSYLTRLPINLQSFEWLFTLKYYSNQQSKQISIQVFFFFYFFEKRFFFVVSSSVWKNQLIMAMI